MLLMMLVKYLWSMLLMMNLCSIWKILHLTEYFYTGTAHGARNNYQVWSEGQEVKISFTLFEK